MPPVTTLVLKAAVGSPCLNLSGEKYDASLKFNGDDRSIFNDKPSGLLGETVIAVEHFQQSDSKCAIKNKKGIVEVKVLALPPAAVWKPNLIVQLL